VGRFDEDGFLYILDRKKDMIVSAGVNVFASDIEEVLMRYPMCRKLRSLATKNGIKAQGERAKVSKPCSLGLSP
jgi:acyl-CoA synthetase (AMP-forming)/AMP-acid ligase II